MGCFGYMCNGCGLSVRGGETSVVKHIRHGEVMGEATGVYDTYGGVEGNDTYRSNDEKGGVNSHHQVWQSEFILQDSAGFLAAARIYKKRAIAWSDYCKVKVAEGEPALSDAMYAEWAKLPRIVPPEGGARSGVEAWHRRCYDRASDAERSRHVISEPDPNQSWGKPRAKYI